MKKLFTALFWIILLSGAGYFIYPYIHLKETITPKNDPTEEILDYSVSCLKQRQLYSGRWTEKLQKIAQTYQSAGYEKKSAELNRLIKKILEKVPIFDSFPSKEYRNYQNEWPDIQEELDHGDIQDALGMSHNKPYALLKLGEYFLGKGDVQRAHELIDEANWAPNKYLGTIENQFIQEEIAFSYCKVGDYKQALLTVDQTKFRRDIERDNLYIKMIDLLHNKKAPSQSFDIFLRIQNPERRLEGLISVASAVQGTDFQLDEGKRKVLKDMVSQNKAIQAAWLKEFGKK